MAFIDKVSRKKKQIPDVQITVNGSRIGFVFRNGVMPCDLGIDVLVGVDEDFGYLEIVPGTTPTRKIGKSGKVCSWSMHRSTVLRGLPDMKKYTGATMTLEDGYWLINLNLATGNDVTAEDMGL